jgi:hypothetical protein
MSPAIFSTAARWTRATQESAAARGPTIRKLRRNLRQVRFKITQRDYVETFNALRDLLPTGADKPALGVIAHTRKPQPNEKRTGGTGLMHLLSGSYILTSVPRCIFIMTRGTQDETDDSVVFFNPKNSNGENAPRSA